MPASTVVKALCCICAEFEGLSIILDVEAILLDVGILDVVLLPLPRFASQRGKSGVTS